MIDSLTVSVLLFVALAIAAVVGWDAWRAWRLRRLSVSAKPAERASRPDSATVAAPRSRPEPSLGLGGPGASEVGDAFLRTPPEFAGPGTAPEPRFEADEAGLGQAAEVFVDTAAPPVAASGQVAIGADAALPESAQLDHPGALAGMDSESMTQPAPSAQQRPTDIADSRLSPSQSPGDVAAAGSRSGQLLSSGRQAAGLVRSAVISDRTDGIALLSFREPVGGDRLYAIAQAFKRVGGKPVVFEGVPVGAPDPQWEPLASVGAFSSLRIGVLLANRSGPLNAMEFADFGSRVQQVADSLGGLLRMPDMSHTLERARELDHDGARLDAQICLNVDATETLGPSHLVALAEPLAIVERGNNRFARLGPRGEPLFSVALGEQPNRLSFLLDLPRVDPDLKPWPAMLEGVRVAMRRLPGKLVDDNGRALGDRQIEQIARDVDKRCQSLIEAGLRPGSAPALRVFN